MTRILTFVLGIAFILSSGCLTVSGDYTPNEDIKTVNSHKYSITYSVAYWSSQQGEDVKGFKETCERWIQDYLEESGAFNNVSQRDFSSKSNYHIHFRVHYSYPFGDSIAVLYLGSLSLFTIPV